MTRVLIHFLKPDALAERVRARFPDVEIDTHKTLEGTAEKLSTFQPDVYFSIKFGKPHPFPREAVSGETSVKWVTVGGSGVDHFLPWDPEKVTLTNSAGVAGDLMSQYVMGAIFGFNFRLPTLRHKQRDHEWDQRRVANVDGQTLLILGLGGTGQALAKRARLNGMRVIGVRANPQPLADLDAVYPSRDLPDILPQADFIAVCVPLTETTRGLIGAPEFRAMKETAVLIDVSRGGVVDEPALLEALSQNRIKGAQRDVFTTEPLPADSPFWDLDNLVITPHASAIDRGWEMRSIEMFCDNLDRWQAGEPLQNIVDPKMGY